MRRLQINKKRVNIIQYYESTTDTRFMRSCVFFVLLYLWIIILYKTFTPSSSSNYALVPPVNKITENKPVCCYVSSYYNMSYHDYGDQYIIIKNSGKNEKGQTKINSKLNNKKSYKVHKHKQPDGSYVTIVKYKGKFFVFYE